MPRYVRVRAEISRKPSPFSLDAVKRVFTDLGYKILKEEENSLLLERGSKLATYIGLTRWDLVYRMLQLNICLGEDKIILDMTFAFSWLTNIASLRRAIMPELKKIERNLKFDKMVFVRSRGHF